MSEFLTRAHMDEAALRKLVAAFYEHVRGDDLIGPMYPAQDWAGAEQRLADFLCFRFLGLPKYVEERGHPRLRARHLPFAIGTRERDRWLALMTSAMQETAVPAEARAALAEFFGQVADFLRNQPEPAATS